MRATILSTTLLFFTAAATYAQEVGEEIVVLTDRAKVMVENQIAATPRKGVILRVDKAVGEWLLVTIPSGLRKADGKWRQGWINRSDVSSADQAMTVFSDELRDRPDGYLYFIRGNLWYRKGDIDRAIDDYTESIRLDPTWVPAWVHRGSIWIAKGELDKAHDDFSEGVRRGPNDPLPWYNRGRVWIEKHEDDKALADLTEAIRILPTYALAYRVRGYVWSRKGDTNKAFSDLDKATRLDPTDGGAFRTRASVWSSEGDDDSAIADLNEAIRLNPKDELSRHARGIAWRAKGEYERAIDDFNESIRLNPSQMALCNDLAWLLATSQNDKLRDGERAVKLATKACELNKWKDPGLIDTLAAAYAETGDFQNAVKWQRKAFDLAPQKLKADFRTRLKSYVAGRPYRHVPKK